MQGELTAIVSQLITFTKRQHYTLVYPGTIQEGGQLTGVSAQKCFDRDGMIAYLEQERFHSGPVEDTHETGVKLKSLVTVYKSEKNKKKKK